MPQTRNAELVAHIDVPGGGQVWVEGDTLLVGHMHSPTGTTLFDVSNPRNPKLLATIQVPEGWHSHKVRASNGLAAAVDCGLPRVTTGTALPADPCSTRLRRSRPHGIYRSR